MDGRLGWFELTGPIHLYAPSATLPSLVLIDSIRPIEFPQSVYRALLLSWDGPHPQVSALPVLPRGLEKVGVVSHTRHHRNLNNGELGGHEQDNRLTRSIGHAMGKCTVVSWSQYELATELSEFSRIGKGEFEECVLCVDQLTDKLGEVVSSELTPRPCKS